MIPYFVKFDTFVYFVSKSDHTASPPNVPNWQIAGRAAPRIEVNNRLLNWQLSLRFSGKI
jgi:hypothetical protein